MASKVLGPRYTWFVIHTFSGQRERARKQLWGVLVKSKNETMTSRWLRSCDAATAFGDGATIYRDEL